MAIAGGLLLYPLVALVAVQILLRLHHTIFSPLRKVPGPFLARFTNLWYFRRIWLGHFEDDNIALHRKYGPIVRYGPNRYSFDHPQAAQTIYGVGSGTKFAKSPWYRGFLGPNLPSLFAGDDFKEHAALRRLFSNTYSMSALVSYEEYVDACSDLFDNRLSEMAHQCTASPSSLVNIGHWFQCYAFDVIGMITYSRRLGFLDHGVDIGQLMGVLEGYLKYSSLVGLYWRVHTHIVLKLSSFMQSKNPTGLLYVLDFTDRLMKDHESKPRAINDEDETSQTMDFLSKFMARRRRDPEKWSSIHVIAGCLQNMVAGSDTTGISLSAVLRYLLLYPQTAKKLREEVDNHQYKTSGGQHISFSDSQEMPYLQAVIKEALRLHPAVGLPLERVVPEGGATICDHFFPTGTIVGVNCWVEHLNPLIYGSDAAEFRPERWIETDPKQLEAMNRHWMPFGLGSRTCIGRHISYLEMSKLIPRIIRDFDFELPQGKPKDKIFETTNYWFVKPSGFEVVVRERKR